MIKFDKNEFLKPQIYSTLDEYETRCNVTKEIIEEIEQLQQENKKLNGTIQTYDILLKSNIEENKQLKDNWNKLKEYFNERIEVCDNRLSSPFCNFEKATKERLIFSQCLEKLEELEELEGSDSNEI